MLCIEVTRNGKHIATAGLPGKGVLSVVFNRVFSNAHGPLERRHFTVGGLDVSVEPNQHLYWAEGSVEIGDEFIVRFLDGENADPPLESEPRARLTESELRRFRRRQLKNLETEMKRVRKLLDAPPREKASKRAERGKKPTTNAGRRRRT